MELFDPIRLKWEELSEDPGTLHVGVYNEFPPFTALHTHDFSEILLITDGSILHEVAGLTRPQRLTAGCLTFIRPHDIHGFVRDREASCTLVNLAFTCETVEEILSFLGLSAERERLFSGVVPPARVLDEATGRSLEEQLTALFTQEEKQARPALRALLAGWLVDMVQSHPSTVPQQPAWLTELCSAMSRKENFLQGLKRMQAMAGQSPEHLARTFRKYLGVTPSTFINQKRLAYTCEILANSNLPIIEVALESGFDDVGYFNRLFKQKYQCTPKQFRRRMRRVFSQNEQSL